MEFAWSGSTPFAQRLRNAFFDDIFEIIELIETICVAVMVEGGKKRIASSNVNYNKIMSIDFR